MDYQICDTELSLLSEKAVFWKEKETLIVSDLHIGKAAHFRRHGIQVPSMVERNNLWRLSGVMAKTKPSRVFFLGDLSHSDRNVAWDQFADFCQNYTGVELILIKGNHDLISSHGLALANIKEVEAWEEGPFLFTHDRVKTGLYNIHGHIHPAVRLKGKGRQSLRVPCFFFSKDYAVMPSFGDFTGSFVLTPQEGDAVFYPGETEVVRLF
jgi:DNA ligase-associated metallophosphoesterase